MKNLKCGIYAILIALSILIGFQSSSFALSLTLSDGIAAITVEDGGLFDSNPLAGVVTYNGGVGSIWVVNVTTGISYPVLGTANEPEMDLNSVDVSTTGPGKLHIQLSQSGFDHFGMGEFFIGGTSAGSVAATATYGSNPIGNLLNFSPGVPGHTYAFSGTTSGLVSGSSPYSMIIDVDITHGGAGATSFNASLAVPEPGTLLFLGAGLLGLGFAIRRRKS